MTIQNQDPEESGQKKTNVTTSHFDYHYLLQQVEEKGKDLYRHEFAIDDIDRPVVMKLIAYFLRDPGVAAKENIDLHKGLLLTGPVGCGKTALMRILSNFSLPDHRPFLKSSLDISLEFTDLGTDVILKYSKRAFNPYRRMPQIYCFDDLGFEPLVNYWGNKINLIAQILFTRYNLMHSHGMITHAITQLNAAELEVIYGDVLRSRMREMFNLIAFQPASRDKRR
jgi:energy-coupling factor transporter ATP-binding protein EcfA2